MRIGSCPRLPFAGSPRRLRRGRRQRRPAGDGPDAGPRLLVVGDPREPTAQLDRRRQFTVLLIDGAERGCISFGDDEHAGRDRRPWARPTVRDGYAGSSSSSALLRVNATRAERPPSRAVSNRMMGLHLGAVQPAIERALPRLGVVGNAGEPAAQLNGSRQLAILLVCGADRGGIGFGDNGHRGDDGEPQRSEQACYQALCNRAACRWGEPLPGNNM